MRKKVKKLWVDALMSGRYVQGKSQLCSRDNRYCCLGVLTELYIEQMKKNRKKTKITKQITASFVNYKEQGNNYHYCIPPKVVEKWAGLTDDQVSWAMTMNDSCNLDFYQIANCIDYLY